METNIKSRVALVCGASKGIGRATAFALSQEGAKVVLIARSEEGLKSAVNEIKNSGGQADYVVGDLSRAENMEDIAKKGAAFFGSIDILVNNTGGPPPGGNRAFSSSQWEEAFRGTFLSAEVLTRIVIEPMLKKKWGRIINLSSISVKQPVDNLILSNSIRLALVGWAKTLSKEVAQFGVTINTIATGLTKTERLKALAQKQADAAGITQEKALNNMAASVPTKRLAEPEELASAVVFLASERASYITGAVLPVDGGFIQGV